MSDTRTLDLYTTDSATKWTEQGRAEFARMADHVASLAIAYGPNHPWTRDAALSFAHVTGTIVGWGDATIRRDGPLSLVCSAVGMTIGVVFHRTWRGCTNVLADGQKCHAVIEDSGKVWTFVTGSPMCTGEHTPEYPLYAPTPGTWATHS